MSAPTEGVKSPTAAEPVPPESPTTARPLEMDDDDIQETGVIGDETVPTPTVPTTAAADQLASQDAPPAKPPRPMTEAQKNEHILKEAFPSIELPVIRAILTASGGRIDPAFHALLQMTDPEAAEHDLPPPPPPPRPVAAPSGPTSTERSQLEADELYARQLAEHYDEVGNYEARTSNRGRAIPRRRQQTGLTPDEDDRERSFIDDDLPVIRDNLRKGFVETQTKVNSWFNSIKKQINEQFDDKEDDETHQQAGNSAFMGRPTRDQTRRSADYERYDADPELLSDDFAGMKFNPDGTPANQRPGAGNNNPNLFRPPPASKSPKPHDGRKVAFSDSVEDIDAYDASPRLPPKDTPPASTAKASKWQPLSTVEPSPITDNDPFSLGDSEDEKEAKDTKEKSGGGVSSSSKEIKMEDTERLRQAAAEAMADSLVDEKKEGTKKEEAV